MTSPEPCTTFSQRKRHYSTTLEPARYGAGRTGRTLCSEDAVDEQNANSDNAQFNQPAVVVADLPECKKCARILAKENSR